MARFEVVRGVPCSLRMRVLSVLVVLMVSTKGNLRQSPFRGALGYKPRRCQLRSMASIWGMHLPVKQETRTEVGAVYLLVATT